MTKLQVSRVASPMPTVLGIGNRIPACWASALQLSLSELHEGRGEVAEKKGLEGGGIREDSGTCAQSALHLGKCTRMSKKNLKKWAGVMAQ